MNSKSKVWHPYTPGIGRKEIWVESGKGAYLYSRDGRKILDAISSWWVNLHGHGHPEIAEAIAIQAKKLEQVIFAGFTHEPAEHLAEQLLPKLPGKKNRLFFSDNGSTAVEVAIKMTLQYFHIQGKPRKKVLALENAYHGDTFGAMAVGARGPFSSAFQDWLFDVAFIQAPYLQENDGSDSLKKAEMLLQKEDVAALIVEPLLQGAGGMLMYAAEWLDRLFGLARKYGTLLIADEVFTGFYRTGTAFATLNLENIPDIICLSKGLTGGFLPLGVTACEEEIAIPFYPNDYAHTFYHGHSFTANPLACAAANASLELCQRPGFEEKVKEISNLQGAFAKDLNTKFSLLAPRHLGTIFAITLSPEDGLDYTHNRRKQIYQYFIEKDLLVRPIGNVLYLAPPYCITLEELKNLQSEVRQFLERVA
jgi:adenosylmethionine-8-amino-7-oxononanoate aminotransferase